MFGENGFLIGNEAYIVSTPPPRQVECLPNSRRRKLEPRLILLVVQVRPLVET
jgi:hypothetical protein